MTQMEKNKKVSSSLEDFNYAEFERSAIAKLMSGQDLIGTDGVLREIIQRIVHAALEGEIEHNMSQDRNSDNPTGNRRNGSTKKKLRTSIGEVEINPPRDRHGDFEPKLVKKWDRNLNSGIDAQIIELYARGNSVEDVRHYVEQMYGVELGAGQITAITDKVWEEVLDWKKRALLPFYVLVYLDAIYFRIRENGKVITKAVYTVYGIDANGERDILDIHIGGAEDEGAKEWGRLLERIKERGVEDVLFFAVDGLNGLVLSGTFLCLSSSDPLSIHST